MNNMNDEENHKSEIDCAVCLQKCNHPTQLPCGHVFCFLCVKGIAFQSKKCAMCRAEIPHNYLDNPVLLGSLPVEQETTTSSPTQETYLWFYEGRNGWWQYDERSNTELETAYTAGDAICTLLLAGTLYNIDFESMTQVRRSDQTRRRRVRRDTPAFPSKGIAGIKTDLTNVRQKTVEEPNEVIYVETNNEVIVISDEENDIHEDNEDHISNIAESLSTLSIRMPMDSQDISEEDT